MHQLLETMVNDLKNKPFSCVVSTTGLSEDISVPLAASKAILNEQLLNLIVPEIVELPNVPELLYLFRQDETTPSMFINLQTSNAVYIFRVKNYQYYSNEKEFLLSLELYDFDHNMFNLAHTNSDKKLSIKKMQSLCKHYRSTKEKYLSVLLLNLKTVNIEYYNNSKVVRSIKIENDKLVYKALGFISYRAMEKEYNSFGITIDKVSNKELTLNF